MAFAATTVWESNAAATGGDTSNGGGFDPGNTAMATDLAATLATSAAPVVTSGSYNFITRDNGHYLFVKGGTNWITGEYPVASTSGNAATLNAAVGAVRLFTNGAFSGLNTVAGCATVASPTGGTWSIDYSQSTAAAVTFTDLVIDATTNTSFTSAANPIGKNFVGNTVSVTSGTGFTVQRIQFASVTGTTGTADKSLGTLGSTGGNGGLGGALISPGKAAGLMTTSNIAFIKSGTYSMTNSSNTAGGEIAAGQQTFIGYDTTRTMINTDATRPLLQASVNSRTLVQSNSSGIFVNLDADANTKTGCVAFLGAGYNVKFYRCKATGAFATAFNTSWQTISFVDCYSSGNTTGFSLGGNSGGSLAEGCIALSGTTGFTFGGVSDTVSHCIAANCTGAGFNASSGSSGVTMVNCSAYNCCSVTGPGAFTIGTSAQGVLINCVSYTTTLAGSYNFDISASSANIMINCAGGNAVAGNVNLAAGTLVSGFISLSANPYTSVSTDFSPNNTAGGGALLRSAGDPATFFGLSTTASAPDIGAVQHAAAAGGPVAGNLRGGYVNG